MLIQTLSLLKASNLKTNCDKSKEINVEKKKYIPHKMRIKQRELKRGVLIIIPLTSLRAFTTNIFRLILIS